MSGEPIERIFFDIGGTLGERDAHSGKLVPFSSTAPFLARLRGNVGARLGIITTLGDLSNEDGWALLSLAGLTEFFDHEAFISEHDADGVGKPHGIIYRRAAERVGAPIGRCLYVGENLVEVVGAIHAGMQGLLKPCPPGRELSV